MPVDAFQIRGVETEEERREVRALIQSVFEVRPGLGAAFGQLYDELMEGDPQIRSVHSRVAFVEGRVAGHTLLAPRLFYLDGVEVPGAVLAMVVVAPEYRGQGLGRALVQNAEEVACSEGALMLHLAGTLEFYRRFGYVDAYTACQAEVVVTRKTNGQRLRRAGAEDAEELARLSRKEVPVGAVVPSLERWRRVLETKHPFGWLQTNEVLLGFCAKEDFCLLLEEGGKIRGCLRAAGDRAQFVVYEAAVADAVSANELLEAIRSFAGEAGYRRVAFRLPANNQLMQAIAATGTLLQRADDPELLVRVPRAQMMMQKVLPVLSARMVASGLSGCVAFRVESEEFVLDCTEGEVKLYPGLGEDRAVWCITLPGIALARAILGTDRLSQRMGAQADAPLLALLDALFPARHPFFWLADSL
ncbi:MAG: GNAT family N-acetyltransferase [bacterium]|nr:GNAT family N-acetyltransferase [bacterium]